MGYLLNNRKLKLVYQCIVLSLVLVFGQGASAITGNQDSCKGITSNLSTNSQDQGIAFPLLPSSGENQILNDDNSIYRNSFYGQYYIKYSGFGFTCIDKFSGIELPASLFPKKISSIFWRGIEFVKNCGMVSDFSQIIQIDENRFCGTKQEILKKYLIMFDKDGIKWKTDFKNASSYGFLMLLGSNRILYGPNILDLETGKVLLELDRKYEPSMQGDLIIKNNFAVIHKSVVIDVEKPAILWILPEDPKGYSNMVSFYEDKLIYFNASNGLVSYYDPSSGELLKTFEFKPRLEPGEKRFGGALDGLAGKSIYSQCGYIIDLESGIVLSKKKICPTPGYSNSWLFRAGDEKCIIWEDDAGIECIDPETGKMLWRKEYSGSTYYQECEGKLYKNTIHLADDPTLENIYDESLSIFEGGSWKELARVPFYLDYITRLYGSINVLSLIPTKSGILWIPYLRKDSKGPSIIAPGTSKVLRTYFIPEWRGGSFESSAGYAIVDNTLLLNVDGMKLYLIDLESGKTEFIQIPGTTQKGNSFWRVPIFTNKKYAVTKDNNGEIVSFDIEKKVFLRRLGKKDKGYLFGLGDNTTHMLVGEWFSAESYIQNLETGEIIKIIDDISKSNNKATIGATDKGFIIEKSGILYLVIPGKEAEPIIDPIKLRFDLMRYNFMEYTLWKHFSNYIISNSGMIDLDKKEVVQRLFSYNSDKNTPFIFNDEMLLTCLGNTVKLSPCPSFSVKRTGKSGGDGKGGAGEVDEVSFEFRNTREDERDLVLKGEAYLVSWGDDGKAPVFAKLNEPRHKLGPLLPGMSQEITFKLPEPPLLENNQKGEGKYFALVVESNGLMDREKSVLSEYDKDPRPLFDGTPVALDWQKAIVVTVWGR